MIVYDVFPEKKTRKEDIRAQNDHKRQDNLKSEL